VHQPWLVSIAVALAAVALAAGAGSTEQQAGAPLPSATPESVGLSPERLRRLRGLLDDDIARGVLPGAVAAVARRGALVLLEARGVQDLRTRTPMTDRSIFRIYSMSKAVTAVAAMTLHEEGRFLMTDPVSKYLPEFRNVTVSTSSGPRAPTREITIRDVFLHTAGFNHRTSDLYRQAAVRSRRFPTERVVGNLAQVPLMEDPGTHWRYSEATTVLGRLVEIWSGAPLDRYLEERVFKPLRMVDTGFWVTPEQAARLTTVHTRARDGGLEPIELEDVPATERPPLLEGAVGLLSTVPDYLRFCQMLLNKGELDGIRVLSRRTVEAITVNALPDALLPIAGEPPGSGWALANVAVVMDPKAFPYPATPGEYAWFGSAGTGFWVDPQEEMVLVYMAPIFPGDPGQLAARVKRVVYQSLLN
jgi:CubicO group peptidase (beta-lactamase class C family)